MPQQPPTAKTLTEPQFNAIRDKLLAEAPDGLSESDFALWVQPRLQMAIAEAEYGQQDPQGSAAGRFLSNAGEMLNPVSLVKGIASAVAHPIDTVTNIGRAQYEQGVKAVEHGRQGNIPEAVGHGVAAALPLVGPAAAEAGEQIGSGDIAGGLGRGVGLLVPAAAPSAVRGVAKAVKGAAPEGARAAVASRLEAGAAERIAGTMSPQVGANKARFGNLAEKVSPTLAKNPEMTGWTRQGLHAKVQDNLVSARQALDEAADARLSARTFHTKPIIDSLLEQRRNLTAEAVEGSAPTRTVTERASVILDERGKPITVTERAAKPVGKDVVPGPSGARVAQIDQAIKELRQLGPVVRYEPIRRIRASYDGAAKPVYAPAMTPDFLKAQGGAHGAADVAGTLREHLAKMDPSPQTAKANADFSLYKTANDVLEATREVERVRPKVGRRIIARLTGASVGAQTGGAAGAIAGYVFAPAVDVAMASGLTTKLKTAQMMSSLAKAIRKGDEAHVVSLTHSLRRLGAQAATLTGVTSPSGSQTQIQGQPAR